MSGYKSPNIILGTASIGDNSTDKLARFDKPEEVDAFLSTFYERGGRAIDTARNYSPLAPGTCEPRLGAVNAGARFKIDTKVAGKMGTGRFNTGPKVQESIDRSIADLNLPEGVKIDVLYLHLPDRETPFEESCEAIDKAYRAGKFQRFGLSNFTAEEVERIVAISKDKGFVAPSVYQGQYNPIVRSGERDLLPVLRKHGIAFYAYGPAAAGTFAGNYKQAPQGGRFDTSHSIGQAYSTLYLKPTIKVAVDHAAEVAAKHGISGHAAALRWTLYHSQLDCDKGDSVIIGASSIAQLSSNMDTINDGPLPQEVVEVIDGVFGQLRPEDQISYHL